MRIQQLLWLPALALTFALGACRVEQTQEGQLPEYEQTQEGQLPRYDVDPLDVDVTTDTQVVEVPRIEIRDPARDTLPRRP
ncbi:MAG: hypothetical protein M3418_00675 [Gemmatimonadota bacterium]|nr:hypothetical protein [Gemmatimonadota bacterium]